MKTHTQRRDNRLARLARELHTDRTSFFMSLSVTDKALLEDTARQTRLSRSEILRRGLRLAAAQLTRE